MAKVAAFRFDWNGKITLLTLLFLPLLIALGFWQLNRAEEKKILQQQYEERHNQALVSLAEINALAMKESWDFRRIVAMGQFDKEHYWLLENQFQHGRLGYHVLMPLQTQDGFWLLVNRGWVPATAYRDKLPHIPTPTGEIKITGHLATPVDNRLIQSGQTLVEQWPQVILEVNITQMGKQLQRTLWPKTLRLDVESTGALDVLWQPINTRPVKHIGYAVQWFTMALVLSILWLFANSNLAAWIKAKRENH